MAWSDRFDEPIELPSGRDLVTLKDAARHIQKLRKAEQELPHWQLAAEILIKAAEGRDFLMHARIAMLKALNHGKPPPSSEGRGKRAKTYRIIR